MKKFLDKDFLLQNKISSRLFHLYAKNEPIFDFHNHLSAKEIYEDIQLGNISNAWLDADHYKWRAMRSCGIPENLVTGKTDDYKRFLSYVATVQSCVGNPLYHWTHLELQRYFGIYEELSFLNAEKIWKKCNEKLQSSDFSCRKLLEMQNVKALCTTDDPVDNLEFHKKIALENQNKKFLIKVLPSFRPDKAFCIEKDDFLEYLCELEKICKKSIHNVKDMIFLLEERLEFFIQNGCLVSDHSLENDFFSQTDEDEVQLIFEKKLKKQTINSVEVAKFKGFVLCELAKLYKKHGIVMQIHIGALRDNCTFLKNRAGINVGSDSLADFNYANELSMLLNKIDFESGLPKMILYNLNPKDSQMLSSMCGNFNWNSEDSKIESEILKKEFFPKPAKIQFGPAWWFCDHKNGIEEQLKIYSQNCALGGFVGMLTDSRSYLSYPRHEYFRRILCNFVGNLVQNGEYPDDEKYLGNMIKNICYKNSCDFFGLKL